MPYKTEYEFKHDSAPSLLQGKIDGPFKLDILVAGEEASLEREKAMWSEVSKSGKFDLTDQLMSMNIQTALPALNNNIENYMNWKIKREAQVSKFFGGKKELQAYENTKLDD